MRLWGLCFLLTNTLEAKMHPSILAAGFIYQYFNLTRGPFLEAPGNYRAR